MIQSIRARLAAAPSGREPKYQTLCAAIAGAISSGEGLPGTRMPTEAELAQMLPYSLGTIQKAYGELVRNGLVVRARGRGSFVAPIQEQMADPWHCRFLGDDGAVLPIYPRLLGHATAGQHARCSQLFGQGAKIIRIDRVISINREFEVLSRFFAPHAVAKPLLGLSRETFETANFKAILLRERGLSITRIVQTIATADKQAWHRVRMRSRPHLVLEATAYMAQGGPAYFQEIYIPPNRRKLLFEAEVRF